MAIEIVDFPMKNGDFPIKKMVIFPLKMVILHQRRQRPHFFTRSTGHPAVQALGCLASHAFLSSGDSGNKGKVWRNSWEFTEMKEGHFGIAWNFGIVTRKITIRKTIITALYEPKWKNMTKWEPCWTLISAALSWQLKKISILHSQFTHYIPNKGSNLSLTCLISDCIQRGPTFYMDLSENRSPQNLRPINFNQPTL